MKFFRQRQPPHPWYHLRRTLWVGANRPQGDFQVKIQVCQVVTPCKATACRLQAVDMVRLYRPHRLR